MECEELLTKWGYPVAVSLIYEANWPSISLNFTDFDQT